MVVGIHIIIACCGTEVPAVHLVLCLAIETTIGQNRERQRVRFVRVFVQSWVVITRGGIVHGTESHSHVRVLSDLISLCCGRELICTQDSQFYFRNGLVLQFALNLHVNHIEVHEVVSQLIVNIERRIVSCVIFIWIQRP